MTRRLALGVVIVAAVAGLLAAPALAVTTGLTFTFGSGAPVAGGDTVRMVSNQACAPPAGASAPQVDAVVLSNGGQSLAGSTVPVGPSGQWSATFKLATLNDAPLAAGTYKVQATCYPDDTEGATPYAVYTEQTINVAAAGAGGAPTTTAAGIATSTTLASLPTSTLAGADVSATTATTSAAVAVTGPTRSTIPLTVTGSTLLGLGAVCLLAGRRRVAAALVALGWPSAAALTRARVAVHSARR